MAFRQYIPQLAIRLRETGITVVLSDIKLLYTIIIYLIVPNTFTLIGLREINP